MRRAVAVCAALFVLLVPAPPVAGAQNEGAVLRVASQTPWLQPDGTWELRLQVAGVPDPESVEVRVIVHRRVSSRSQFDLTLDGRGLGSTIRATTARLSEWPPDAVGARRYAATAGDLDLTVTGVYPVEVVLRERGGDTLDRLVTHLLFLAKPIDGPRLGVSWIMPVHATPSTTADGERRAPALGPLSTLVDVVQSPAYAAFPLALAPTPETLAGLAASRDAATRQVLDDLKAIAGDHQVLARPWVPVDVRALVAGGLEDELAAQRRRGRDVTASVLGVDPDTRTWVAGEALDDAAVRRLRDLQVDRVVVPETDLAPVELSLTLAQPFELDVGSPRPIDAVMADGGLRAHFTNRGDQVLAAHQLLADLAVLYLDSPQRERAVVIAPPRTWRPTRAFLDAALQGLTSSPVLSGMSIGDVFSTIDAATVRRGAPMIRELATSTRTAALPASRIRDDRGRIEAIGSTLPVNSPEYDALDRRLLTAESADLTSATRADRLASLERGMQRMVDAVLVPRSRTLTLTAREGEVPLTFQNRSDDTLTVLVRLDSDRLEFPDGTERSLVLPPRNTTMRVRVRARTSGAFPLRVTLVSPQGGLALASSRFTVRSTAASGVGVALSAGAGLFLLLWWARHLVRGRRARRLVPA
ncbi:MAG TPA: DUF6049 family protein [Acidimicrobiales bacterium]|jgi:hypothetical protein|nr:DUF6049 family protein [Acidimicrobiales bacterium]